MKKLIGIIVLSLALLLSAGCTFEINLGEGSASSGNASKAPDESYSEQQGSDDASQAEGSTTEQTQKSDTHEDDETDSSQNASENEGAVEVLLNAPTVNYCNINGSSLNEGYFVYTTDSEYGELFSLVVVPSDYSYVMMIAAFIPQSWCKEGLVLRDDELTSDAGIYYAYVDTYSLSAYELLSSQSPASFSDTEFCLYSYAANESAIYSIKANFVGADGNTVSVDLGGGGAYTDPSQFQQIQSGNNTGTDGTCWACHGSKICSICLGKRKYYVSGYGVTAGSYVNCAGCNGTGRCSYCS